MTSQVISTETLIKGIGERLSCYSHIIGALRDRLENGILCLKNVAIDHNGGRHCILVRDLSRDKVFGERIDAVVKRFNRVKEVEITISRNDISENERFNYSYIVVVQQGEVKSELP